MRRIKYDVTEGLGVNARPDYINMKDNLIVVCWNRVQLHMILSSVSESKLGFFQNRFLSVWPFNQSQIMTCKHILSFDFY